MQTFSASLFIKEMKIKVPVGIHLTAERMTIIEKPKTHKCICGCNENRALLCCWWERDPVQPLWKSAWKFLKLVNLEIPHELRVLLLGIFQKELKTLYYK